MNENNEIKRFTKFIIPSLEKGLECAYYTGKHGRGDCPPVQRPLSDFLPHHPAVDVAGLAVEIQADADELCHLAAAKSGFMPFLGVSRQFYHQFIWLIHK